MFLSTQEENKRPVRKRKQKKKKSLFGRIAKFLFSTIIIIGLIVSIGLGIYTYNVISNINPIDPAKISDLLDDTSFIYDSQGNLLERVIGSENRTVVSIEQIPKNLQNAVVAIEDERFYEHNGVDVKRVFGALWHDIKTLSLEQGASTITMQLAKNLYTGPDKSLDRKITDAYNAIQIEKFLSKDKILYYYLNQINLGRGNYGVQAASNHYFSKDVSELNLAESAILAGISKNPSRFSVYTTEPVTLDDNFDEIQTRLFLRDDTSYEPPTDDDMKIFDKLLEKGKISRYEYSQLKNNEYYIRKVSLNQRSVERQQLVLKAMLKNELITEQEYNEALNTPIIIKLGKNKQSNISSYFADKVKVETLEILTSQGLTKEQAQDLLLNGGLRIYSTMDPKIQNILETEINNSKNYPRTRIDEQGVQQPQVAAVVIDHTNGFVRGLIGGRGISGSKIYNRALNPRQPGSSIKPIAVYLPALENGFTPGSPVDDSPITEGNYRPKNYSSYDGPTTIRNLIVKSSNVGAVKVAKAVGPHKMIKKLQELGISTLVTPSDNKKHNDENLSLALGGMTRGTTPLDMASAYGALANKGSLNKPVFVKRIEKANGTLVYEYTLEVKQVTSPQIAYLMTSMLQDVVSRGTGVRARVSGQGTAGKTGTTNDEKDVWFVGYTPYYSGAVWIGEDIPKDLNMTSDIPTALWGRIMNKVHSDLPSKYFRMPSGIVGLTICDESGLQAGEFCTKTRKEYFLAGTTPKEVCDIHDHEHKDGEEGEEVDPLLGGDENNQNTENPETTVPETTNPSNQNNQNNQNVDSDSSLFDDRE